MLKKLTLAFLLAFASLQADEIKGYIGYSFNDNGVNKDDKPIFELAYNYYDHSDFVAKGVFSTTNRIYNLSAAGGWKFDLGNSVLRAMPIGASVAYLNTNPDWRLAGYYALVEWQQDGIIDPDMYMIASANFAYYFYSDRSDNNNFADDDFNPNGIGLGFEMGYNFTNELSAGVAVGYERKKDSGRYLTDNKTIKLAVGYKF